MLSKIRYLDLILGIFFINIILFSGCKSIDIVELNAVSLNPSYKILNDSIVEFKVDVVRNIEIAEEYFPCSERLRVEILDFKGNLIWASNAGSQYFMAIGKVEPLKKGDKKSYILNYNYRSNKEFNLINQQISVNYILPVSPKIYFESLKIFLR